MAIGPGKYDKVTSIARILTGAHGVILIVIDGIKGSGASADYNFDFEVQMIEDVSAKLPGILREIADKMEEDLKRIKQ